MSIAQASLAAASSASAGGIDWVRTIGLLGITGVWMWRGVATVSSRRRQRAEDAAERQRDADQPPAE